MRYRKKPIGVEAFQFNPERRPFYEWAGQFSPVERTSYVEVAQLLGTSGCDRQMNDWAVCGVIETLEGKFIASPGDWIVRGVQGEFYPVKNEIFQATYETVAESEEQ